MTGPELLCAYFLSWSFLYRAVSLALELAKEETRAYPRLAVVDLDVANPYFRSRERKALLEENGVALYGDVNNSTGATAE